MVCVGEKQTLFENVRASVAKQQQPLSHWISSMETKKLILSNMADWFYTGTKPFTPTIT